MSTSEGKRPSGTVTYLYGNGLVSSSGETLLPDGLGATRQTTSSSQSLVWTGTSQAFGVPLAASGGTGNHYQWGGASGYRSDGFGPTDAAALLKVGARYYDPEFGCFLSRDTDLSQSPYAYCNGDPVNNSDPTGHLSIVNIAAGSMVINGVSGGAAGAPTDTTGDNKSSTSNMLSAIGEAVANDITSEINAIGSATTVNAAAPAAPLFATFKYVFTAGVDWKAVKGEGSIEVEGLPVWNAMSPQARSGVHNGAEFFQWILTHDIL